jgi:hypothetical protein
MPEVSWVHHGPSCRLFKHETPNLRNQYYRVAGASDNLVVADHLVHVSDTQMHYTKQISTFGTKRG